MHRRREVVTGLLLVLVVGVCALAYRNGLRGPAVLDDLPQISPMLQLDVDQSRFGGLLSSSSGPLGRPLAMATFIVNGIASGDDLSRFKGTNLALHLVTGLAIFWFTACLLSGFKSPVSSGSWTFAGVVGAAWLLHPLHVSSVLYTVQRMTQLSTLFTFLALLAYGRGRRQQLDGRCSRLALVTAFLFGVAAVLSKENGILFPLFALLLEIYVFRFRLLLPAGRRIRGALYALLAAVVFAAAATLLSHFDQWVLDGYRGRDFTMGQRLLTEPRVLVSYIVMLFVPLQRYMGYVHDDVMISTGLFSPATTFAAILGIAGLLALAWRLRLRAPLIGFGIAFFFAGHLLEAGIFPLEIMFEHRNYLPAYGLILAAVECASALRIVSGAKWAITVATLSLLAFITHSRADSWASNEELLADMLLTHPQSERVRSAMAWQLADGHRYAEALRMLEGLKGQGAALHRIEIECLVRRSLSDAQLASAAEDLRKTVNSYAQMELENLANLGLDGKCTFSPERFLAILGKALALSVRNNDARYSLTMYKAHYEKQLGRTREAIATLRDAYAGDTRNPTPLFLETEWLLQEGLIDDAAKTYAEAKRVATDSNADFSGLIERVGRLVAAAGGMNAVPDGALRRTPAAATVPQEL